MIINKNTALFLDRDGVLNEEIPMDYVKTWDQLILYPYTLEALRQLATIFNKIFIVTNQKGVGKKLMDELDLINIHFKLVEQVEKTGGRIDKIYYCTALSNNDPCRKPNAGMAFKAKQDFPEIDLTQSFMVGNNISDMEFAKNAGLKSIFVTTTNPPVELPHPGIDLQFANLLEVAQYMQQLK
jgi:histidinol-phosphate phosphatase family protein